MHLRYLSLFATDESFDSTSNIVEAGLSLQSPVGNIDKYRYLPVSFVQRVAEHYLNVQ